MYDCCAVSLCRCYVFLLSIKATSMGVNLVSANRVILVEPQWNPAIDRQALFRTYRYGQTKPVFVYRFVMMVNPFLVVKLCGTFYCFRCRESQKKRSMMRKCRKVFCKSEFSTKDMVSWWTKLDRISFSTAHMSLILRNRTFPLYLIRTPLWTGWLRSILNTLSIVQHMILF